MTESEYTISLNDSEYRLNEEWRWSIERRAQSEYEENEFVDTWWRTADESDVNDPNTIHEEGDPILVIETEGPIVPWDRLDQLELEMQDTDSFQSHDTNSGSDVDEGNGMKTVKRDAVDDASDEKDRLHFAITPQNFEELPSPDGERDDRMPAEREEIDEPSVVAWVPDNPDLEHTWSTGRSMVSMHSVVEWNVQKRADQPRDDHLPRDGQNDSHDHFEALAHLRDAEKVGEIGPSQKPDAEGDSDTQEKAESLDGKYGGSNWQV